MNSLNYELVELGYDSFVHVANYGGMHQLNVCKRCYLLTQILFVVDFP